MAGPNEKGPELTKTPSPPHNRNGKTDKQTYSSAPASQEPAVEQLEDYEASGAEFIPLIGKVPGKGWRITPAMAPVEAMKHLEAGGNIGIRLRPTDLVIDVDPRNFANGDDPIGRLANDLGIDLGAYPRVETGSGGSHYYMRLAEPMSVRNELPEYPGVEFKCHGRQVVSAGSVHPRTGQLYLWDEDPLAVQLGDAAPLATEALVELIQRPEYTSEVCESGDVEPEQLETMLEALAPEDFRDNQAWLDLMMACHHATAGSGREQFLAWSLSDQMFSGDEAKIKARWRSLHLDSPGRQITQATLFKALADAGRCDLIPRPTAEEDFAEEEADDRFDVSSQPKNAWWHEWVWIAEIERFVRRLDLKKFNEKQFTSMHQHRWPDGPVCPAVWKGKLAIKRFESLIYLPSQPEVITEGQWQGRYNLWRAGGIEPEAGDVSAFLEHMEFLFPNKEEREHVLDYLSFLVAPDFVKVHFALLIQGKPGTGKSFLAKLVRKMIGENNVSTPLSSEVVEKYTGWQEGVQLAILEELMALGRKEVSNTLKPVITDDFLRIRLMHTNVYSQPNFLNLLCITNHKDALPIEPSDRRWLVIFSECDPKDEAYYEQLFGLLEDKHVAAIKHYLQQRQTQLNPKGVAPRTRGKAEMQHLSLGEVEQHLDDMLADRADPFDHDLVRVDDVIEALPSRLQGQKSLRHRVAAWLRDVAGAKEQKRYKKQDGSGRKSWQLWSVDNHSEWEAKGAAACIDAYMEWRGLSDKKE